jgi:hypothetical protein
MIPSIFTQNQKVNLIFADKASRLVLVKYLITIRLNKKFIIYIFFFLDAKRRAMYSNS